MPRIQNRRHFLSAFSAAGTLGLFGAPISRAEDAPLETTRIRFARSAAICHAPQYIAEDLLRAEGFTHIQYVARPPAVLTATLGRGEFDFSLHFSAPSIMAIDAGDPLAILAGVHVGCFELVANEHIRSIRDLKGKKVGIQAWGVAPGSIRQEYDTVEPENRLVARSLERAWEDKLRAVEASEPAHSYHENPFDEQSRGKCPSRTLPRLEVRLLSWKYALSDRRW